VFFDPKDQGIVRHFTIRTVTPEEESGGVVSKNVTIDAAVESLAGEKADKTIFVTMQRRPKAAWLITGVTVAAADPSRSHR
jgi:hypothetical protein